jgi:hypothetical protein
MEEKLGPTCQASTKLGSEEEEILAGHVLLGEETWTATRCAIDRIWGYLFGVIYL